MGDPILEFAAENPGRLNRRFRCAGCETDSPEPFSECPGCGVLGFPVARAVTASPIPVAVGITFIVQPRKRSPNFFLDS